MYLGLEQKNEKLKQPRSDDSIKMRQRTELYPVSCNKMNPRLIETTIHGGNVKERLEVH